MTVWWEDGAKRPAEGAWWLATARYMEHRSDRPYDEQDPGHVATAGGLVGSQDRAFLVAATKAAIAEVEAGRMAFVLPCPKDAA